MEQYILIHAATWLLNQAAKKDKADDPWPAQRRLVELRELLDQQPELEAGGSLRPMSTERSESMSKVNHNTEGEDIFEDAPMNPEALLSDVEAAMLQCHPNSDTHFCIFAEKGEIFCRPKRDTPPKTTIIAEITQKDIREGLRPAHWNRLGDVLVKIKKAGKL